MPPVSGPRTAWKENFGLLLEYYRRHGDCFVDDKDPLAKWMREQRNRKSAGSLSTERERKLNSIKFPWEPREARFEACCEAAEKYAKLHGNLDGVPPDHRVNPPCSSYRPKLAPWISNQRSAFAKKQLSKDRVKKLEKIPGWTWVNEKRRSKAMEATSLKVVAQLSRSVPRRTSSAEVASARRATEAGRTPPVVGRAAAVLAGDRQERTDKVAESAVRQPEDTAALPQRRMNPTAACRRGKPRRDLSKQLPRQSSITTSDAAPPTAHNEIAPKGIPHKVWLAGEGKLAQGVIKKLTFHSGHPEVLDLTLDEEEGVSRVKHEHIEFTSTHPADKKRAREADGQRLVKKEVATKRVKSEHMVTDTDVDNHVADVMVYLMEKANKSEQERNLMRTLHNHLSELTRRLVRRCLETSRRPEETVEKIKDIA